MSSDTSETDTVDTRTVVERRTLSFHSLDDIRADVEQLAGGEITAEGNWTPGQVFMHLARFMDISIDGHAPAPWLVRKMVQLFFKKKFLQGKMRAGFKLPDKFQDLVPGEVETSAGVRAILASLDRLKSNPQRKPHPVLGELSSDQWNQLHCRHAELHLSFLHRA